MDQPSNTKVTFTGTVDPVPRNSGLAVWANPITATKYQLENSQRVTKLSFLAPVLLPDKPPKFVTGIKPTQYEARGKLMCATSYSEYNTP